MAAGDFLSNSVGFVEVLRQGGRTWGIESFPILEIRVWVTLNCYEAQGIALVLLRGPGGVRDQARGSFTHSLWLTAGDLGFLCWEPA